MKPDTIHFYLAFIIAVAGCSPSPSPPLQPEWTVAEHRASEQNSPGGSPSEIGSEPTGLIRQDHSQPLPGFLR